MNISRVHAFTAGVVTGAVGYWQLRWWIGLIVVVSLAYAAFRMGRSTSGQAES